RLTLNTSHPRPWGWKVWTYLWTKSISAGALLVAALLVLFTPDRTEFVTTVAPFISELFLAITAALLIWDLKRPDRFLFLLDPRKINKKSWLALGGIFLTLGAAVGGLWFLAGAATWLDLGDFTGAIDILAWPAIPAAIMVAGYTAFLFGQAEGRDLWQSPVLFWHLQAQAVMVGSGALLIVSAIFSPEDATVTWLTWALIAGITAHLLITLVEFGGKHSTRNAQVAAHAITHGRYSRQFYFGSIGLSLVAAALAFIAIATGVALWAIVAGLLVQVSLVFHEKVFVKAAQDPPLS
ncbi:MAG: NrfD/PsrC family molybdoenzyme membrane anchor subunit, partial [Candidatus Nanopelagicales bacterium]